MGLTPLSQALNSQTAYDIACATFDKHQFTAC